MERVDLKYYHPENVITAGIGAGIFLIITTFSLAFILFGRLTEVICLLLAGELLFTIVLSAVFFHRHYHGLGKPVATGILLSILAIVIVIVSGTTLIHDPLPPPDSPAWSSGSPVIVMAVRGDEITSSSPEAKDLLIKGLTAGSRNNGYAQAISYYDEALALDPDFTEAWMAKGVALHNLRSYEDAVGCLDRALALDPGNAAAWSLKGSILSSWGRPDEAAGCYARAAEIDPGYQSRVAALPPTPLAVTANG